MSRQTVVKTISELNELLDEESGVSGGAKKKKMGCGIGGVKIAYGSGLIAAPNQYGFDPYINGFVPPQQRGGYGIGGDGGLLSAKKLHAARVKAAENNPWVDFAKQRSKQTGLLYKDVISDPRFQREYHEMQLNEQEAAGIRRMRKLPKLPKRRSMRRLRYIN